MSKTLHITNGDSINNRISALQLEGDFLVWREMLCEGPTKIAIESTESIETRKKFLKSYYKIQPERYERRFLAELKKLDNTGQYKCIVLWFEFDLFCHINMTAAISYLLRKHTNIPIYLVCGGKTKNESQVTGLVQLNDKQLIQLYKNKVLLEEDDLLLAKDIWTIYCEKDPMKIISKIKQVSAFPYLSSCLRAHVQRFPNMRTGLNVFEQNILELVDKYHIKNTKQLIGYILEYQGYYGYNDMQIKRTIGKLLQFFELTPEQLKLSYKGTQVLQKERNFYNNMVVSWNYGGVQKYDYLYNSNDHKLLKL